MWCQAYLLPALSGINAPSSTGGVTPLRLPALTLRGYLHVVQDGSAFFPRAFGLVRRVVLFSNGRQGRGRPVPRAQVPRARNLHPRRATRRPPGGRGGPRAAPPAPRAVPPATPARAPP